MKNTGTVNTAASQSPAAQPPELPPEVRNVAVTLPLVDALLSDESFEKEIRSHLSVSEDQIQKLKDTARDAVLNLDESEAEDPSRSTAAASQKAEREVKQILGAEKGQNFLNLVRQRLAGSASDMLPTSKPNSVPTDTRVVVNIPAYRMDIFQNGSLKKSYKIGIGYPEFPLPTGLRKADTIIFNPTWTPPDEPWVKGKFKAGKTVEAGSKDNPLGPIKIPIGLPSLIHGGKAPARLGTFASHGCVGLTNGQIKDFALELSSLTDKAITEKELADKLADKSDTEQLKLAQAVPVELRYETIVVEDGKLRIFRDVYERGTNTEENLRTVIEAAGISLEDIDPASRERILSGLRQMAYDATGNPVEASTGSEDSKERPPGKTANASGKITRNIKGQRAVEFDIPQLKGKGYPAPKNLVSQ